MMLHDRKDVGLLDHAMPKKAILERAFATRIEPAEKAQVERKDAIKGTSG